MRKQIAMIVLALMAAPILHPQIIVIRRPKASGPAAPVTCSGYSYYAAITLPTPAGALTNVPIVAKGTLAGLKTVANGGNLAGTETISVPYSHAVPADFILKDADGTTSLTNFEFPMYVATTGEYELWVNYPSLTTGGGTIYACWGNAGATTFQGNVNGTWNSAYVLRAHLQDGTTLGAQDSTVSANNGTLVNSPAAAAGKIDGGITLDGGLAHYINWGSSLSLSPPAITFSTWVHPTSLSTGYETLISRNDGAGSYYQFFLKNDGKLALYVSSAPGYDGTGAITLSTSTWYHIVLTYDSSAGLVVYVNGSVDKTVAASGTFPNFSADATTSEDLTNLGRRIDGVMDEISISNVARSPNWVALEYANQNTPMTLGTATAF